ncbi:Nucleotidyltransferase, partial [Sistotremastrum suecicum HHB10207 ss-3]
VATPATLQKRSHTVQKIQNIIHKRYGRKYQLEVFGSTRYGVDTESSDLDLVIIDPDRILGIEPHIFRPNRLADVLRREQFTNIQAIPFASVPIVKFHDPDTGIQGDININHQLGLFNTHLLAAYCNIYPNLRVLIRAVKTWAKSHGLNEPSPKGAGEQTSFSSYALTLMIVVFLQVKGVIPNLQSGLPPFDPTASTGLFWLSKKGEGKTACDVRFRIPHDWVPSPSTRSLTGDEASVGDLLVEWFRFWGWEADYGRTQASIKHGG